MTTLVGGPTIMYGDESLGWDWEATCTSQLQQFLTEQLPGRRISAVKIVLVDVTIKPIDNPPH